MANRGLSEVFIDSATIIGIHSSREQTAEHTIGNLPSPSVHVNAPPLTPPGGRKR